jgi:hypothetical protein
MDTAETPPPERARVTIIYKSGATIDMTCDNVIVRKRASEIVEIEWVAARPRPLHIGLDDIAAVWEHVDDGPAPDVQ